MAADEICTVAEDAEADADLCSSKSGCGSCVDTVLTDGASTCQWLSNVEFCASGCGMAGCGETTCSSLTLTDESPSCEDRTACEECLDSSCAWAPFVGCLSSCGVIADTSCFSVDVNITGVCESAGAMAKVFFVYIWLTIGVAVFLV
jgi:hypothetical protein